MSALESLTVRTTFSHGATYSSNERKVRRFDKESILDLSLKPILKYTFIPSPHATAEPSDNTSPGASAKPDEDESGERTVDPAQERIQQLEKELAELKVAKSELEDRYQCERGMRRGAEMKISWLEGDLKESQDLVAQLEKRSIETI